MSVKVKWFPVGGDWERPIRERSLWLAMPNGTVMIGFRGRAHDVEFPYAPIGEVAWRGVDGEPVPSEPTHWAYIEVPKHPGAKGALGRHSKPGLPRSSPGDDRFAAVTARKPAKRYQRKTVDVIHICGLDDEPLTLPGGDCSNAANHTPAPAGYVAWHAWAERMTKTHNQVECPGCELFMIWEPKVPTR